MRTGAGSVFLGRRLRDLRVAKGLTQRELAEPYYTHAYISTIEAGRRSPSERALSHFAGKLGVTTDELRTGRPPTLETELEIGLREARKMVSAGRVQKAEERFASIARSARRHKLLRTEASSIYGLALCAERRGKADQAIELYEDVRRMLQTEPLIASVDAIAGESRCHLLLGDVRYGIHLLETTLSRLERERLNDPGALLRIHASLVGLYFEAGLYKHAYESAAEALRLAPDAEDNERAGNMFLNVAWALNHQGEAKEAHDALLRAQFIFDQIDLKLELGRAHLARGMMLSRHGNKRDAKRELRKAQSIFAGVNSPVDIVRATNELARLARLTGDPDTAGALLAESLRTADASTAPALTAWAEREMGLCLAGIEPARAEKHFRNAIQIFKRAEETVELAATYRALGDLLHDQGDRAGAYEAFRQGLMMVERGI